MKEHEIERLAALIAETLARKTARGRDASGWVPAPVRPEPPVVSTEVPPWTGAAQRLSDVGPSGASADPPAHRRPIGESVVAIRAAAAGKGSPATIRRGAGRIGVRAGARGSLSIDVPIGVSNRHLHISPAHFRALFGKEAPDRHRDISQPGQFAALETVELEGPRGRIPGIRIVGPARGDTQLELSRGDARRLGIDAPVADSGDLARSTGGITLHGAKGSVALTRGVIIAARHLHLSPSDASRFGLAAGDRVDIRCGDGARRTTFHGALVRTGPTHATEFHLDADEANAAGVKTGDRATIIGRVAGGRAARRPLVTERQMLILAERGASIPADAILTPSARDRARALGLLTD